MASKNMQWGCCTASNDDKNSVRCSKCKKAFHILCLNASKNKQSPLPADFGEDWLCPRCYDLMAPKEVKSDNTPIRQSKNVTIRPSKRPALSSPPGKQDAPITRDDMKEIMEEVLKNHIVDLKNQFINELATIKDEMKSVHKAMDYMSDQMEDVLKKCNNNSEQIKALQKHENEMQLNIAGLMNRINLLEQNARCKNVEIQCIPEKKSENLIGIVKEISSVVGLDIKDENIVRVTRTAKLNPDIKRPRSIVVELNNTRIRDTLLAAIIKFNKRKSPSDKLNSSHLGYSGPTTPIYVMEHLSPQNKSLHAAARQAAKDKKYKYVWVRGGKIFMRKNDDAGYIYIRDSNVLSSLK